MSHERPAPRRELSLLDATAIDLGAIIGAGVFVVLGEAAGAAAGGLPLAIVVAGAVAALSGLSAAELGVNYPFAGGPYEFGYQTLSPLAGFTAGWIYLFANLAASTALTLAFANYLLPLAPGLPSHAVAAVLAALATAVNLAGVRQSGRVNDLLVAFKVGVLLTFVLVGLAYLGLWRERFLEPFRLAALPRASGLLFFAYAGFSRSVVIADQVRDPARTLPRSVIIALAASATLYLTVAIVALGLVGGPALAQNAAPLRAALVPTGQTWAQILVSLGALVATADVLLTAIWSLSRVTYAMAVRGDLPGVLARVGADGVPRLAIVAMGAIAAPLAALVAFGPAVAAASLGQLTYYGIMDAAAWRLRPAQRLYPRAVPAVGLLSCAGLAFSLPVQALLVLAGVTAIGLAYYFWWHR